MSVRKLKLEEWFLMHQLDYLRKNHFYVPIFFDVDVTHLAKIYEKLNVPLPVTQILIKASSLLLKKNPDANKVMFKTFYGPRVLELDHCSVNLPIVVRENRKNHYAGMVVNNAEKKSIEEISDDLHKAVTRKVSDLPVGKYIFNKKNTFFNRTRLRFIHFLMSNFPSFYRKAKGGGITVSSVMNLSDPKNDFRMVSFTNTIFTIGCCQLKKVDGKSILRLSAGFDHSIMGGEECMRYGKKLCDILRDDSPEMLQQFT